jgi:WS/DGAT/MGAT family acyltransferase
VSSDSTDRRLSLLDASFLYYEQPNQPLHVGSVAILDGPVALDGLRDLLAERLGALPRYRQHPVRPLLDLTAPRWEDDVRFDPAYHVRHARVAARGDEAALHATIDTLFSTPCDLARSPWETWLVDGLADGRAAILSKVHHCMIDGVSGAQVLEVMTDPPPGAGVPSAAAPAPRGPSGEAPAAGSVAAQAMARIRSALDAVAEMSAVATTVTPLPFNGSLSPDRRIRWATFGLDEILALRGRAGCKVNDVVLAIITGALRTHLAACGAAVDALRIRTLVPVSIRRADEHLTLGNRVSAMFATLPVDRREPLERLHAVVEEMRRLKAHGQAEALALAMTLAGTLPTATGPLLAALTSRRPVVHTVCTNVPGPRDARYVLGRRVLDIHPIVPIGLEMGLGFAILSYDQRLSISATADPALVPDAERLPEALRRAADELHEALGTRPAAVHAATPAAPTVGELMTREVITIGPEDSLAEAWSVMQRAHIRHLPVVDARGALAGLITHRDLLAAAQSRVTFPDEAQRLRMLAWAHVDDVMETHVSTVTSATPAAEAGARMAEHKIGCLPVVDDGRLTGLVTEHDFLRWATANMAHPPS